MWNKIKFVLFLFTIFMDGMLLMANINVLWPRDEPYEAALYKVALCIIFPIGFIFLAWAAANKKTKAVLEELVHQIDISDAIDARGHKLVCMKALHDAHDHLGKD